VITFLHTNNGSAEAGGDDILRTIASEPVCPKPFRTGEEAVTTADAHDMVVTPKV
jgi:hypothetical protein